jgi:hypothetical protein
MLYHLFSSFFFQKPPDDAERSEWCCSDASGNDPLDAPEASGASETSVAMEISNAHETSDEAETRDDHETRNEMDGKFEKNGLISSDEGEQSV